ncbi:MAG: FHA domain-containing protein [Chloroflexota bacterium]|nr:FHA domain-containing protein [Chloroflexota bacterium]
MSDDIKQLAVDLKQTHTLVQLDVWLGDNKDKPTRQTLLVKKTLRVRELTDEIARAIMRDNSKTRADYKLFAGDKQLSPRETIGQFTQAPILLEYRKQRGDVAFLDKKTRKTRIEVKQLPAILGRFGDGDKPEDYTVNFSEFGNTISRKHARLIEAQGQYYIQNVSSGNFLYVDGDRVEEGSSHLLKDGYKVRLGEVKFVFEQKQR